MANNWLINSGCVVGVMFSGEQSSLYSLWRKYPSFFPPAIG